MSDIKLSALGKSMGKQMAISWEAPQFTLFSSVNCENMIAFRAKLPFKTSYTTILIKAVTETIAEFPILNSSWDDGTKIVQHETVNMGIAVDTKRGLLVPVIKDAGKMGIEEIHAAMQDIKGKSTRGNFSMDEMTGGTIIISNLGMFNITMFSAIVNAPNSAILSIGKMNDIPVVKNGRIEIGKTMEIGLNLDHRVIDGATGAKILTSLVNHLENLHD